MIEEILLRWEAWVVLGITMIILDVVIGLGFFALSFGLGAMLTALLLSMPDLPVIGVQTWAGAVLAFSLSSLFTLPVVRWLIYRRTRQQKDISDY